MAFYIFPRAIPKKQCETYLKYCLREANFEDASTVKEGASDVITDEEIESENYNEIVSNRTEKIDELRKTQVHFISDRENLLNEVVWGFIREANARFFNYKLNYFQSIQFAKYEVNGHYAWHQDASAQLGQMEHRKLSLTLSLSDRNNYDGGYLEFFNGGKPLCAKFDHDEMCDVSEEVKEQGTVIVFDSRDWHRVTPVTKGIRYSLVCWTIGPRFE